ncbi:unnamed protein product [Soboliphyme baturini]|uniref:EamA domain-containing protein n=1 Tax=Soboliphyme baturini TaxID=241478 RepID=A0A183J993_9BILA|nr:unnamed protein product [Soboliphyme baturini]
MSTFNFHIFRRLSKTVSLGQLLSLCLCVSAVTSKYLSLFGVDTPTTQSFLTYFLLCFVYGTKLACRTSDIGLIDVFRSRGWKYFVLAFIDVEANFLLVKAYQHTSLASVQLLDCFTIPVVLILSFIFLKIRYLLIHIVAVTICLIGIGCLVWGDIELGNFFSSGKPIF